jgi:CDP-glucose 4,6-dehydratase
MLTRAFWEDRKVFLTGHTGFKGGWMAVWLKALGARVAGYALPPSTMPSFFNLCRVADRIDSCFGDVRDAGHLTAALKAQAPDVVFHFAAQPLVRRSYHAPLETLDTNIMGTAHVLEAVRRTPSVRAVIVVTSDKCYENRGGVWGRREDDPMGGNDPYSASKGCAELIAAAYQHSFFRTNGATIATVRAGNVIGGGDWSEDRIVPDAIRALGSGRPLAVRNPHAVRPWQHVLAPLSGYLMLAEKVFAEPRTWAGGWNFGPEDADAVPVSTVSDLIVNSWGDGASWENVSEPDAPHEDACIKLETSKARQLLGWRPRLALREAVEWSVAWYRKALDSTSGDEMWNFTRQQISCYEERM